MTPEERAAQVRAKIVEYYDNCRPSSYAPWRPFELGEMDGIIAAAIRAAVAEMQERCAKVAEEYRDKELERYKESLDNQEVSWEERDSYSYAADSIEAIARRIRELK